MLLDKMGVMGFRGFSGRFGPCKKKNEIPPSRPTYTLWIVYVVANAHISARINGMKVFFVAIHPCTVWKAHIKARNTYGEHGDEYHQLTVSPLISTGNPIGRWSDHRHEREKVVISRACKGTGGRLAHVDRPKARNNHQITDHTVLRLRWTELTRSNHASDEMDAYMIFNLLLHRTNRSPFSHLFETIAGNIAEVPHCQGRHRMPFRSITSFQRTHMNSLDCERHRSDPTNAEDALRRKRRACTGVCVRGVLYQVASLWDGSASTRDLETSVGISLRRRRNIADVAVGSVWAYLERHR